MAKDRSKWHDELGRFAKGHGYLRRRIGLKYCPGPTHWGMKLGRLMNRIGNHIKVRLGVPQPWPLVRMIAEEYGEEREQEVYQLTDPELRELIRRHTP